MAIFDEFPYTNFHDKNLDGMCKAIGENKENIAKNAEQIYILKGRMQIAEQQIDQHANQIADLSGRMVTAETKILQNRNSIVDLSGRMTSAETELDLVHHMADNHESEISQIHVDLQDHENRITALEQGGGGGGGFSWGTAELILQGGQRVPIKYNFDAGFFIIPDTSSLACSRNPDGSTANPVTGIEFITGGGGTVPMTFYLKYVIPMCTDDISVTGGQYFTVSAQWTMKFNGGTAESCRCNPVTYSTFSGSLIRGQLVTFPIFGVCY